MAIKTSSGRRTVDPSKPETIPKFADALPIPAAARRKYSSQGEAIYEIEMRPAAHQFHRDFPASHVWAYNGRCPGPTIEAGRNETIYVKWKNQLPDKHFLPVDKTLHGSEFPEGRTVVHVHGANVPADSDGHPDAWFTKDFAETGPMFSRKVYRYTNRQPGATLWYHDHAIGLTRLNVYAGLAGFYLIRDPIEKSLNLPRGLYEIPLMIQDRSFNPDGSLFYPANSNPPNEVNPSVVPAFNGNTIAVNGKLWPFLKVEPRKYRFRIVNASNTNGYELRLGDDRVFHLIGTDGGLLEESVELNSIPLDPAERVDIVVDFSKMKGRKIILRNAAEEGDMGVIMRFDVTLPLRKKDTSDVPMKLQPHEPLLEESSEKTRLLTLGAITDEFNRPLLLLDNRMWHDPVTETPRLNSIETWRFINLTAFAHPIHVHLVQFKILHRQPFDLDHFLETGAIVYTGPPVLPGLHERGWKDTVHADDGMVTSVIMQFKDYPGDYVWHCHILEHEDYDMMRPMKVIDEGE